MNYPDASMAQREFFREHGWLVVEDAVALDELAEVSRRMEIILEKKQKLAFAASLHEMPVEFWYDPFLAKPPRDGAPTYWHQDEGDLLYCEPDLSRRVACPIRAGSVTFHHGKTPHMTPPNTSVAWRRAVTTHMRVEGSPGEEDHFAWKTSVNQITGETTVPPRR
jgi:ectoine hydroxylase-related dioxygenase (phytanoyl-CoA dioxygenase family)